MEEARGLHDWVGGGKALCTETQFAARGSIEELVGDHPVLRISTVVDHPAFTTPMVAPLLGTKTSIEDPEGRDGRGRHHRNSHAFRHIRRGCRILAVRL